MKVYNIGTTVVFKVGKIEAIVDKIVIENNGVGYRCCWWDGRQRRTEWVNEFEIMDDPPRKTTIGFHK